MSWKMSPSRRIWVSPPILHPFPPSFFVDGTIPQREQTPPLRQWELFSWRWFAIPRCRRRLKPNLTKSLVEDFPNIAISLPFPTSRHSLKKFIGMLQFSSNIHLLPVNCVSTRWQPVLPLGRPLFVSNILVTEQVDLFVSSRPPASVNQRRSLQRVSYPR